jgi:hypothetical protein
LERREAAKLALVPDREDLDAAIAHAEAVQRDLDAAREENAADYTRIAELEKRLADARDDVERTKLGKRRALPWWQIAPGVVAVTGFGVVLLFMYGPCSGAKAAVDITGDIAGAQVVAAGIVPDPVLKRIEADHVSPQGIADLAAYGGTVVYEFVSPSRAAAAQAPTGPIGAPSTVTRPTCNAQVQYRKRGRRTYEANEGCGDALPGPPSCSVVEVWTEAIRRGAPSSALASIRLAMEDVTLPGEITSRRAPAWHFKIFGIADMTILDRCPMTH